MGLERSALLFEEVNEGRLRLRVYDSKNDSDDGDFSHFSIFKQYVVYGHIVFCGDKSSKDILDNFSGVYLGGSKIISKEDVNFAEVTYPKSMELTIAQAFVNYFSSRENFNEKNLFSEMQ
jgi:hypothetical protein